MNDVNPAADASLRHRVLVVDHDESLREEYRSILENAETRADRISEDIAPAVLKQGTEAAKLDKSHLPNFELGFASQGEEGLQELRRALTDGKPYALAFVEMRMPTGWDGLETVEHFWAEDPELQIVICTAHSDHNWEEMYTRIGATQNLLILKKPLDIDEVRQMATALTIKWRDNKLLMAKLHEFHQISQTEQSRVGADDDSDLTDDSNSAEQEEDTSTSDPNPEKNDPSNEPVRAERKHCAAHLDVLVTESRNQGGKGRHMQVTTIDVSTSGLALTSKNYIHPGSIISFSPPGSEKKAMVHGQVMYCNYSSSVGYRVGVKFLQYREPI